VLVAGAVTLTRGPSAPADAQVARSQAQQQTLAQVQDQAQPQASLAGAMPASLPVAPEAAALVANGSLIRDARLDRYLAAHKQFAGSSALGVPSGYLRNATAIESAR
jgi:sigma-E factor negative regulatory protein RseA